MSKAVFLDRDGVIIRDTGYLGDPRGVLVLPGVPEALTLLRAAGWKLVVVTNQSGIARGFFSEEDHLKVRMRMEELLAAHGVGLDGYFHCPHGPWEQCSCRKPRPGMVFRARDELGIQLEGSFVVGDKMSDLELAWNVGIQGILVGTSVPEALDAGARGAMMRAQDLLHASKLILGG